MKKSIVVLFISISLFTNAQFVLQWQHRFGGLATDQANCIIQTSDSGYAVLGNTNSNDSVVYGNHGGNDYLLFKLDINGNEEWHRWYGSSVDDIPESIIQTPDGGYLMAGTTNGNDGDVSGNHGGSDVWLIKTDYLGFIKWQKCYGGAGSDGPITYYGSNYQSYPAGISIINTLDGGFMLGTSTNSNNGQVNGNHGGYDYWLVKLNDSGAIQWQKCYGGNQDEILTSVIQNSDGSYAAAGYSASDSEQVTSYHNHCYTDYYYTTICSYDYWIIKIDTAGNLLWEKSFGGTGDDIATSIAATNNGGYIVAGFTMSSDGDVIGNHGYENYWLVRLDSTGSLLWKNCYGGSQEEEATSVVADNNGGFMVVGNSYSYDIQITNHHDSAGYGGGDIWAVLLDSSGTIIKQNSFGGLMNDGASCVIKTNDGGFAIAGNTNSNDGDVTPSNTEVDFWVLKINTDVGLNEIKTGNNVNVYPNPNNGDFIFSYNQSNSQFSALQTQFIITDVTGRTVLQKNLKIENEKISINTNLENGIYFWQLNSGNKTTANGKLVILK
jgi:hypothetical protein